MTESAAPVLQKERIDIVDSLRGVTKDGPALRLQQSPKNGILKIVIAVKSLKDAKAFLESNKMSGKVNADSIFILPAAVDGLQIEIVEN